jgi:general secretion pathway protein M
MTQSTPLAARWAALPARERQLVVLGAALVAVALLWWVALAPALATLRAAPARHKQLDAQLQQMRTLQAQAQTLQVQAPMSAVDARRALEASVKPLGTAAQLVVMGERVTVTFNAVAPDALAQWLTQARLNARAVPSEAKLVRNGAGSWDGTVLLNLGPR